MQVIKENYRVETYINGIRACKYIKSLKIDEGVNSLPRISVSISKNFDEFSAILSNEAGGVIKVFHNETAEKIYYIVQKDVSPGNDFAECVFITNAEKEAETEKIVEPLSIVETIGKWVHTEVVDTENDIPVNGMAWASAKEIMEYVAENLGGIYYYCPNSRKIKIYIKKKAISKQVKRILYDDNITSINETSKTKPTERHKYIKAVAVNCDADESGVVETVVETEPTLCIISDSTRFSTAPSVELKFFDNLGKKHTIQPKTYNLYVLFSPYFGNNKAPSINIPVATPVVPHIVEETFTINKKDNIVTTMGNIQRVIATSGVNSNFVGSYFKKNFNKLVLYPQSEVDTVTVVYETLANVISIPAPKHEKNMSISADFMGLMCTADIHFEYLYYVPKDAKIKVNLMKEFGVSLADATSAYVSVYVYDKKTNDFKYLSQYQANTSGYVTIEDRIYGTFKLMFDGKELYIDKFVNRLQFYTSPKDWRQMYQHDIN